MAGVPCTIIVSIDDSILLPMKMALTVLRQIFKFGVKDISQKGNKILIWQTVSPKTETLQKKFGNLPIKYIRMKLTSEEEFKLFNEAMNRFQFDIADDEELKALPSTLKGSIEAAPAEVNQDPDIISLAMEDLDDIEGNFN